ncbi:hypothetical protein [Dethiosulfatarculus sandiegensis]|uniref:Lipoprotein n=1 Tax=Dethiosulfatarculus sandiegensis TaxID=1429043 RepID=A0A0D2J5L8_9BACT|nr:hypothetical protein [Dethiosulfatarculus sandiegensis]KIX13414.1 hypothetical protein X474_14200 [Dethiosulfatarculus sandiegensis]
MKGLGFLRYAAITGVLAGLVFACACQAPKKAADVAPVFNPTRVLVLPFLKVEPDTAENGVVRSPLTGATFFVRDGISGLGGLSSLDRSLEKNLADWATFEYVPESLAGKVFNAIQRRDMSLSLMEAIKKTGEAFKTDAALVGHLYRFSPRVGGELSAEKPASVAFDLTLVRIKDGQIIWKNSFDETQKSLTENIFNLGEYLDRGIRWYTAEELAGYGMDTLLTRFPWRKQPIKTEKNPE